MTPKLDAGQSEYYRSLGLENDYALISGVFILPLAEDPPENPVLLATWKPFVEVDVHANYRVRQFKYQASKERTPPVLPAPADQGAYTFLGGSVNIPHPFVQSDGSTRWTATVSYFFAEGCVSDASVGFVIGNSLDALANQVNNANYAGSVSDAPANIRLAGVGPKAGWALAKAIDTIDPSWDYREPSYYPAQLLSTDLVSGPESYPVLSYNVVQQ